MFRIHRGCSWLTVLAILSICLITHVSIVQGDLEGFEDEIESPEKIIHASPTGAASDLKADSETSASDASDGKFPTSPSDPIEFGTVPKAAKYALEIGSAIILAIYLAVAWFGMVANKAIAEAWAREFTFSGGVFDKNFASLGPDSKAVVTKESGSVFKFYATGRRHCQGLLAELTLLARQDMLSMIWNLMSPEEDLIKIEVFMTEESMPPIVLAIATPKHARAMQRDCKDIIRYTRRITVGKEIDKLWVLAEHSSIFQDLFSDPKLLQIFSSSGPYATSMKYFRSMHFTSDNDESSHKRVLRFAFKLPPANQMGSIAKLMELVPLFIDVVGSFKLSPELKKRALEARVKQEEDDEEQRKKRLEAIQQRKIDKAQEERAKVLRMTPEARQKYEDKMQRQNAKRSMKSKVVRV